MEKHNTNCRYEDNTPIYALMELGAHRVLIAASEVGYFNQQMQDVEGIKAYEEKLTYDEIENLLYTLVYGAVMTSATTKTEDVVKEVERLKDCTLVSVNENEIKAACYQDIELLMDYEDEQNGRIPFAALMQIHDNIDEDETTSQSYFACYKNLGVFESLLNRHFILACRRTDKKEGLTKENWRELIDYDALSKAFEVADLYTGPIE